MAGKRVRLDSKFQLKKCAKRYHGGNDGISQLPDDILVAILSLLSLKEAARTSVLSSRWINLWKQTSALDFNADSALVKIAEQYKLRGGERRKYVKWVNHVLQSHKAATLKEFRVSFDLGRSSTKSITRWLEFALVRHVQKLELDFSAKANTPTHYAFPEEFLTRSSGGDSSSIDFKSLKELSFKCVNVTDETIEFFLRNCPLLEKLVVDNTNKLSNIEVCGPSLVLKHLEIGLCYNLKSVRVSAPNLTSLIVHQVEGLFLENVPMLFDVSANCMYHHYSVNNLLTALSCCISQLEILTLRLRAANTEGIGLSPFPELPKLKKLVIEYWTNGDKTLMGLTPLIRASPYLQEFVLKFMWCDLSRLPRKVKNTIKFPHQHLKVFKFCGYYGRSSDVELVRYIFKNCVVLEKLIIDPHEPLFCRVPLTPEVLDKVQIARDYAKKQLQAQVPQHVELVIL